MANLRQLFESQFDERWRAPLAEFGKRISDSDADILIFMARKAACLFRCFEDLRLAHTSAACSTDLVLESSDLHWLKDKRVELIDDTLISGTTLYRSLEQVRKAKPASLAVSVFCVDRENWSRDLVDPTPPYEVLASHEVTAFSAQVVAAIGIIPRPYSIDFPVFSGIRLAGHSMDEYFSASGWELDDLTTATQAQSGAVTFTLTPPPDIVKGLDRRLGWRLSEQCQLLKLRVYARRRYSTRPATYCRIVPMVVFDPLSHAQLASLWDSIARVPEAGAKLTAVLRKPSERLRLLQFVAATNLFYLWFEGLQNQVRPARTAFELEYRQVDFAFPPVLRRHVLDILRSAAWSEFAPSPRLTKRITPERPVSVQPPQNPILDPVEAQSELTKPFLDMFQHRELPARALVSAYGARAFRMPEYGNLVDRLRQGISVPELALRVSADSSSALARSFVSRFIDRAIDHGVIVPVVVDDGACVYRAYRHGEDVKFTEAEARLTCLFLREFAKSLQQRTLPRVVAEKGIVLFLQMGLRRGFIERWTGTIGDRHAVGIRYYLHGAVAQVRPDRRPYCYSPEESLTALFASNGYLKEHKDGTYEVARMPERTPTTAAVETEARALGNVLGLALRGARPADRDSELTLVASCSSRIQTLSAMAAEIHYFEQHWGALSTAILGANGVNRASSERLLRAHPLYTAINSGLWKCQQSERGVPAKAARRWRAAVGRVAPSLSNDALMEGALPQPDTGVPTADFDEILRSATRWLYEINITLRELRLGLLADGGGGATRRQAEIESQLATLRSAQNLAQEKAMDDAQLSLPFPSRSPGARVGVAEMATRVDSLAVTAGALLDRIDAVVTPFGRARTIYQYRHLLAVRLFPTDGERRDYVTHRIAAHWRTLASDARKAGQNTELFLLRDAKSNWSADCAVAATGLFAREWLCRCMAGALEVARQPVTCDMALWVDLDAEERIIRADLSSDVAARHLQTRQRAFMAGVLGSDETLGRHRATVLASSAEGAAAALEELQQQGVPILRHDTAIVTLNVPSPRRYHTARLEIAKDAKADGVAKGVDLGIITVVSEETHAVMEWMSHHGSVNKVRLDGAVFYTGSVPAEGGVRHSVATVQQLQQGNRSVIMAYERLCKRFDPVVVALVGIGGSLDPDVHLGDVVIAEKIWWYEQATVTSDGVDRKGEASRLEPWLQVLVNDFFVGVGNPHAIANCVNADGQPAKAYFASIGTGEKVVRWKDASIRRWLRATDYKTKALETEAGGLAQAFYETGLTLTYRAKGYLVVRGISDHADYKKSDGWRNLAAKNACSTLGAFLETVPAFGGDLQNGENAT